MKNKFKFIFNNISSAFFKKSPTNKKTTPISDSINSDKSVGEEFKQQLANYLSKLETTSKNYDYQEAMNYFYMNNKIKLVSSEEELLNAEGKNNNKDDAKAKQIEKDKEREMKAAYEKLEKENEIRSNLFNDFSLKILKNTDNTHLISLANKSFVGDTDIPKDYERSMIILKLAKTKTKSEDEIKNINFYIDYFTNISKSNLNLLTLTYFKS
jgi:hypothetical protein